MKSFTLDSLWILSHKEQAARFVTFSRQKNLIYGKNHTGKSSMIKTLFLTLGAIPKGKLTKWDKSVVSLLSFFINNKKYHVVRQNDVRALFNDDNELISSTNIHSQWIKDFGAITGFNLVLTDKRTGSTLPAGPECFFLPFYINQDGTWQAGLDTFVWPTNQPRSFSSILEYFSGIKPAEFYKIKAQYDAEQKALNRLERESKQLENIQKRLTKKEPLVRPQLEPENFSHEITALTAQITHLNGQQEKYREKLIEESDAIKNIELQLELANSALRGFENDFKYIQNSYDGKWICPTCNAEHTESELFKEVFVYLEDARTLRSLRNQLNADLLKIRKKYQKTRENLNKLTTRYTKIKNVLSARKGKLTLDELVVGLASEKANAVFQEEIQDLSYRSSRIWWNVKSLKRNMDRFNDKNRKQGILDNFARAYQFAQHKLNIGQMGKDEVKFSIPPDISGSGGPRATLAYYYALWTVCCSPQAGSYLVPIVIDSPNQKGQDEAHLTKMMNFISEQLPVNTQLILAAEHPIDYHFDNTIVLDEPEKLLNQVVFKDVEAYIEPFLEKAYDDLKNQTDDK